MKLNFLYALLFVAFMPTPGFAQSEHSLFADSLNLPLVERATIPTDCNYPEDLRQQTAAYQLACVNVAGEEARDVATEYGTLLQSQGWQVQEANQPGRMVFLHPEGGCNTLLALLRSSAGARTEIWFLYDPVPRCPTVR